MLRRYQNLVSGLLWLGDALVLIGAWLASYWLRFSVPLVPVTKGFPPFSVYASLLPIVVMVWLSVFAALQVYQLARRRSPWAEAVQLLRAHVLSLMAFISLTYLFDEYRYSRLVTLYFGALSGLLLVVVRVAIRDVLRRVLARGRNLRQLLIVGEGVAAETLIARFDDFPELGLRVCGVVTEPGSRATEVLGKPVLGYFSELVELIRETSVDEVLIALPWSQQHESPRILELLKDEIVDVRVVPDLGAYVTLGCEVEVFDGVPVVRLNDSPLIGWYAIAKRTVDVVLAAAALVAFAPLMLVIALLVRLSSPGPIFYAQERMGLDGRTFSMLKFRSMKLDAEADSGAVWANRQDNRRTVLGSFLRKTSLDELPQLWNVLRGDMSLVGPRPERPVFVHQFRHEIPHYMLRHKVKAGITGWAQVNGWRGNTSLRRRIECDLYYIQNWSLTLDLKILTLTLWKGFVNKNAY